MLCCGFSSMKILQCRQYSEVSALSRLVYLVRFFLLPFYRVYLFIKVICRCEDDELYTMPFVLKNA